jgi:hypothetical protein
MILSLTIASTLSNKYPFFTSILSVAKVMEEIAKINKNDNIVRMV